MSQSATAASGPRAIAVDRRSTLQVLSAIVRDPLRSIPPAAFHEPLVRSTLAGRSRLYLCDPVLINEVLVRNAGRLSKGDVSKRVLRPVLGNGMLTAEGSDWRWQRQSAAPAFQPGRLLGFAPAMLAAAERTRDRWLAAGDGAVLDIGREMMLTTFAIIVDTMLSGPGEIDVGRIESSIAAYLDQTGWAAAFAIVGAPRWLPHPGRRRGRAAANDLRAAVRAMVAERRGAPDAKPDLVSLLLAASDPETGRWMTDEEIADNLLTFITAGHETTAQGLSWTLHLVTEHPRVEAAIVDEIERVTGGGGLLPEHIPGLVYTRQVFSEAMRLYPPAPMVTRKVEQAFEVDGLALPAGTAIIVPTYAVHRHSALWDDPEAFDPDRFTPARSKARHRCSYMPFGAGPRICIGSAFAGLEAVAILAIVLRAVRLEQAGARAPEPTMRVTLRPKDRLLMRMTKRPPLTG